MRGARAFAALPGPHGVLALLALAAAAGCIDPLDDPGPF